MIFSPIMRQLVIEMQARRMMAPLLQGHGVFCKSHITVHLCIYSCTSLFVFFFFHLWVSGLDSLIHVISNSAWQS